MHDSGSREQDSGRPVRRPSDEGRAVPGEVASSSKGLGAVFGDAERIPDPGPVRAPGPADKAAMDDLAREYEVVRTEDGPDYLLPRQDARHAEDAEQP